MAMVGITPTVFGKHQARFDIRRLRRCKEARRGRHDIPVGERVAGRHHHRRIDGHCPLGQVLRARVDDRRQVSARNRNRSELSLRQNLRERIVQIPVEDVHLLTELLVDAHHGVVVVEDVLEVREDRVRIETVCDIVCAYLEQGFCCRRPSCTAVAVGERFDTCVPVAVQVFTWVAGLVV